MESQGNGVRGTAQPHSTKFWKDSQGPAQSEEWATPLEFFNLLHAEFGFTLDACAAKWNAKNANYYDREQDGLSWPWTTERVWMNPPYGKAIDAWLRKARREVEAGCPLVVALVPARTDTAWWHDNIEGKAEIRFVRGRLEFTREDGSRGRCPFPSAVVIYRSRRNN